MGRTEADRETFPAGGQAQAMSKPKVTMGPIYRVGFVRPEDLPIGAEAVVDPEEIASARRYYASITAELAKWGPTEERTILMKIEVKP